MENKKEFGEYLQLKRKEKGLTQKEFAQKLFITEFAVSKWERGLSYPDITLIKDICEILEISEHELLTASEDTQMRNYEKYAKKYERIQKVLLWTQIILYGAGVITCFICNLAIDHKLSWFFIVLTSEMVAASITLLPMLVKKKRGLITLASFTVSLFLLLLTCSIYTAGDWMLITMVSIIFGMTVIFLPFILRGIGLPEKISNHKTLVCFVVDTALLFLLLFVCDVYTKGSWFFSIALPITLFSLILPWGMMLVIRYAKINGFFKTAICIVISSAFMYFTNGFVDMIVNNVPMKYGYNFDFNNWEYPTINENINVIIFLSLIALAALFAIAGIIKEVRRNNKQS